MKLLLFVALIFAAYITTYSLDYDEDEVKRSFQEAILNQSKQLTPQRIGYY